MDFTLGQVIGSVKVPVFMYTTIVPVYVSGCKPGPKFTSI